MKRLLSAGFITQSREDVNYKNVTGTFRAEPPGCGSGGFGISKQVYTFNLVMASKSPAVSGQYTFDAWYADTDHQRARADRGPVQGEVSPDGTLHLVYGPMYSHAAYKIDSQGGNITLTGTNLFMCSGRDMVASGTGPGGIVTSPRFSYGFSDSMKKLLDPATGDLRAGRIKIDGVHDLILQLDTIATATYQWHVNLNAAGEAVVGKPIILGKNEVTFRKQPDGTWVLPSQ